MSDQTMYQRMVAKGVDMSWYARNRHATDDAIPLYSEACNKALSIYLLRIDGTLWTVDTNGAAYRKVRTTNKPLPRDLYICAHTKAQYSDFESAVSHGECRHAN